MNLFPCPIFIHISSDLLTTALVETHAEPMTAPRAKPAPNPDGTPVVPRVILRPVVLSQGMTSDDVQRMCRRRAWVPLRPGAYVEADALRALAAEQRHIVLIDATMPSVGADLVISHVSAACLFGIDMWQPNLRAVQLTRPGAATGHRRRSLHTFRAAVEEDEIVQLRGYRVTSPARTVVDLARILPFEAGVVAADAALRSGLTTREGLAHAATRSPKRPGMRRAHRVIALADAQSESVGESRSRVMVRAQGLPDPVPQFLVRTAAGYVVARCDFGWEEFRTVGEFDGAQKYGRLLRPGESPGDKIYREKLREDQIRDEGWQMVRWTWDELQRPREIAARLLRAFERGRRCG